VLCFFTILAFFVSPSFELHPFSSDFPPNLPYLLRLSLFCPVPFSSYLVLWRIVYIPLVFSVNRGRSGLFSVPPFFPIPFLCFLPLEPSPTSPFSPDFELLLVGSLPVQAFGGGQLSLTLGANEIDFFPGSSAFFFSREGRLSSALPGLITSESSRRLFFY